MYEQQSRKFVFAIEFECNSLSDAMLYFIRNALVWELRYVGYLMNVFFNIGYSAIQDVSYSEFEEEKIGFVESSYDEDYQDHFDSDYEFAS